MMMGGSRRTNGRVRLASGLLFAVVCLLAVVGRAADENSSALPRLSYSRFLKGSAPEYLAITVDASGQATFDGRKEDDPPGPHEFKLSERTTRRLFQLAQALDNFQSVDLESHKRVANLGLKTFTYENNGKKHQAEFNYTQRRDAQELVDWFERIASVEQHILSLEHAIKYDHLSLPGQLRQIQIDLDKRALADPELMTPTLEKIARSPRFLHLAQSRAQDILQRLHSNN
jgi:hypothetical protein